MGNPFSREMPSMPAFPEQRVLENNPFFSSPEYRAFIDSTSGRPATQDMYNSPYFGTLGSGSVGRAQDEAYRSYMQNNGQPDPAPPQQQPQQQPFRPIEGMAGNLVGGFTPPPGMFSFGQQMPAQNTGFFQGAAGPQQALDVTQGSLAYPPSLPGQQAMGLGMGAMGAMGAMGQGMPQQSPMQSPTQSAFQQAAQKTPANQLSMYSNMQQATPMQSNMGQGMGGQSNMFSNAQQATPMQSNMGQGAMQSVGQTSSNMFGGGPFASAAQSGQQAQQPQQGNAPVRSGGIF